MNCVRFIDVLQIEAPRIRTELGKKAFQFLNKVKSEIVGLKGLNFK